MIELVAREDLTVVAMRCHLPPGSLPTTRKTAGWEEEKCQEMEEEEEEMVREVMEASCSDEGGGLQACWQPSLQVRGEEQREEIWWEEGGELPSR